MLAIKHGHVKGAGSLSFLTSAMRTDLLVCTNSTVGSSAIWSPGSRVLRRICTLVSAAVESIVCVVARFAVAVAVELWKFWPATFREASAAASAGNGEPLGVEKPPLQPWMHITLGAEKA